MVIAIVVRQLRHESDRSGKRGWDLTLLSPRSMDARTENVHVRNFQLQHGRGSRRGSACAMGEGSRSKRCQYT